MNSMIWYDEELLIQFTLCFPSVFISFSIALGVRIEGDCGVTPIADRGRGNPCSFTFLIV